MKNLKQKSFWIIGIVFLFISPNSWGQVIFEYTGEVQEYVVPPGISLISVEAFGAEGGTATNDSTSCSLGGLGGSASGNLEVTPGETLYIYVGGRGYSGNVGGWNGGGESCSFTTTCGKGGGASDVRQGGTEFDDRVIVAGGGGGAEWSGCTGGGGDGGGLEGEHGTHGVFDRCGGGGSQVAGGTAGVYSYDGEPGEFGVGGAAGSHPAGHSSSGGGGWYGGGGSAEDGHAGGGSSYIDGLIDGVTSSGVRTGNGQVIINELCSGLIIEVSDYDICFGETVVVTGESITGGIVMWSGGIEDGVAFNPGPAGTYSYTATSTSGSDCLVTIEIVVHALPTIVANADPEIVCYGQELTLSGSGGAFYEWTPGDIEDDEPFVPELGIMTYSVEGEDWYGCFNTAEVTVEVIESPVVMAHVSDDKICLGESVTLTGSGAISYEWDFGVVDGVSFTPEEAGTYVYTVIGSMDDDGCTGEASIEIVVNEVPTIDSYTTIEEVTGDDGSIDISVSGGTPPYDFDWDNDEIGEFGDTEDLTGISGGTYVVVVLDANGCEDTETIIVDSQLGIDFENGQKLTVYPNPTNGIITISGVGEFTYELSDINGKSLMSGTGVDTHSIDLTEFSKGVYFIRIQINSEIATLKVVKD